jgi:hypothetical protein
VQTVNYISSGALFLCNSKQWRAQLAPISFLFKHPGSKQCLAELRLCALSYVFEDTDSFSACLVTLFF